MELQDILKNIESFSPSAAAAVRERKRQIDQEGYTPQHDLGHIEDQLAYAAICYASPQRRKVRKQPGDNSYPNIPTVQETDEKGQMQTYMLMPPVLWPWGLDEWKPTPGDRARELEKAAALLIAERDRILAKQEKH